jgi:hypothetical protein
MENWRAAFDGKFGRCGPPSKICNHANRCNHREANDDGAPPAFLPLFRLTQSATTSSLLGICLRS